MRILILQFLRYSVVGLLNTALGLFVIWGLMLTGFGPYSANVAGYAVGLVLSFFLNRAWTFRAQRESWPVARFLSAFAIAYGANLSILTVGLHILPEQTYFLQLIAVGTYSVLFFLLCRLFVFSAKNIKT